MKPRLIGKQEPTRYRVVVLTPRHPVSLKETVPAACSHNWLTRQGQFGIKAPALEH